MNPFLRMIAFHRWQDPTVTSWVVVLWVQLSITPNGVCVQVELRRQRPGKLEPFGEHVTQFHGLGGRARLCTSPSWWTKATLHDFHIGYRGLRRVWPPEINLQQATARLFERRQRRYIHRHGAPNTVAWCLLALAEIFAVHGIHLEEENQEKFDWNTPDQIPWKLDDVIHGMQRAHLVSERLRAAGLAEPGAGFIQAPTSPAEIAAIRRCLHPEKLQENIRQQLWREVALPDEPLEGRHAAVGDRGDYFDWLVRRPDQWRFPIRWVRNAETDEPVCPVSHQHQAVVGATAAPPAGRSQLLLDGRNLQVLSPDQAARHRAEGLPVLRCYVSEEGEE